MSFDLNTTLAEILALLHDIKCQLTEDEPIEESEYMDAEEILDADSKGEVMSDDGPRRKVPRVGDGTPDGPGSTGATTTYDWSKHLPVSHSLRTTSATASVPSQPTSIKLIQEAPSK